MPFPDIPSASSEDLDSSAKMKKNYNLKHACQPLNQTYKTIERKRPL